MSLTACTQPVYGRRAIRAIPPAPLSSPLKAHDTQELAAADYLIKPHFQTLIVLDPGHGGQDYGTYSSKATKYQEKNLTLTATRMVKTYLEQMGYRVSMTRTNDTFVALDKRAAFANERTSKLFVSIHFNSAPNKQAEGVESPITSPRKIPHAQPNLKSSHTLF